MAVAQFSPLLAGWEVVPWGAAEGETSGSDWEDCEVVDALAREPPPAACADEGDKAAGHGLRAKEKMSRYGRSKYRGVVYWVTIKSYPWRVCMYIDGKRKLDEASYETEEAAARAYDEQARRLGRPERQLNFPRWSPEEAVKVVVYRGVHAKVLRTKRKGDACEDGQITRYTASIRVSNRSKHLGTFDDEKLAALAYDRVARELGRDDSQLNFPHVTDYSPLGHAPAQKALTPARLAAAVAPPARPAAVAASPAPGDGSPAPAAPPGATMGAGSVWACVLAAPAPALPPAPNL